ALLHRFGSRNYWVTLEGNYARGVRQYGFRDLNLVTTPRFTLPDEAGRPVYVPVDSIVPTTGAVSSVGSRIRPEFGDVLLVGSDLQSDTKQLILSFTGATRWGASFRLGYTLTRARDQSSYSCCSASAGFAAPTTASDPNVRQAGAARRGTVPHPQVSPPPARRDRRTQLVHRSLAGLARFAAQLATRVVRARPAAHHVAPDGEPAGGPRRVAPRPRATAWLGIRPRPRPRAAVCARLRPDDEPVPLRRERAIRRHCQRQRRRHRPLPGCGAGPPGGRPGSDPAERNPATGAGPARPRHPSARQPDHADPRITRFARLH